MTIRPIRDGDISAAAALIGALDRGITERGLVARLNDIAQQSDHRIWIYEDNGVVSGVAHAFVRLALEKPREIVVQSIAVDPSRRSTGIGRALIDEIERWARESDCSSVALHTRKAAPFYEKLGYAEVATPAFMRKTLI